MQQPRAILGAIKNNALHFSGLGRSGPRGSRQVLLRLGGGRRGTGESLPVALGPVLCAEQTWGRGRTAGHRSGKCVSCGREAALRRGRRGHPRGNGLKPGSEEPGSSCAPEIQGEFGMDTFLVMASSRLQPRQLTK